MSRSTPTITWRRVARALAMQALCQFDAAGDAFQADLNEFLEESDLHVPHEWIGHLRDRDLRRARRQAQQLAQAAWAGRERYDAILAKVIRNWDPTRLGVVERAVLRLTTHELADLPDVPAAVAVNEAIEIARAYGAKESAAFVNGVLDAVRSHLDSTASDHEAGRASDSTPTNRTDVDQ